VLLEVKLAKKKLFWKDIFAIRLAEWTIIFHPALRTKIIEEIVECDTVAYILWKKI